jgi:hypothetical protein
MAGAASILADVLAEYRPERPFPATSQRSLYLSEGKPRESNPRDDSRRLSRGKGQSRNTRAGSVRVARQAGTRQAATEVIVITANAKPNASGSRGVTL